MIVRNLPNLPWVRASIGFWTSDDDLEALAAARRGPVTSSGMAVATESPTYRLYEGRRPYPLVIGGEEVSTGESFAAIDPEHRHRVGAARPGGAKRTSRPPSPPPSRAFESWRTTGPALRQQLLLRCADAIEAPRRSGSSCSRPRTGGPGARSRSPTSRQRRRSFATSPASSATRAASRSRPRTTTSHVYTVREPLGVIAAIIPWNSPLITSAQKIAPALAAGNTLVLKPSEFASPSVVELATLLGDILPPGALNVVTGFGPDVGAALVSHPGIAKISFTGGGVAARRIMAAAAEQLTPSLMELGGKSPMVVCADADLETAVQDALLGIFLANGEVCFASSRLLVHEDVYDAFLDRFAEAAAAIRVGHALDPETQVGPLVTAAHRDRVARATSRRRRPRASSSGSAASGSSCPASSPAATSSRRRSSPTPRAARRSRARRSSARSPSSSAGATRTTLIARANASEYGLGAGRLDDRPRPRPPHRPPSRRRVSSGSTSGSTRRRARRWAASRRAGSAASSARRRCTSTARRRRSTSGSPASARSSGVDPTCAPPLSAGGRGADRPRGTNVGPWPVLPGIVDADVHHMLVVERPADAVPARRAGPATTSSSGCATRTRSATSPRGRATSPAAPTRGPRTAASPAATSTSCASSSSTRWPIEAAILNPINQTTCGSQFVEFAARAHARAQRLDARRLARAGRPPLRLDLRAVRGRRARRRGGRAARRQPALRPGAR